MCGIVAIHGPLATLENVARASEALRHRGPDDSGVWCDANGTLALGHRRLSILDLTPTGRQPMLSHDGRFTIVLNGEIYNFQDLRAALESKGVVFRGRSDTEVLLEAISAWGLEGALQRCVGMFALVLWDARERRLFIARDRLGEKPLYYGYLHGNWLIASELKALQAIPGVAPGLDRTAVALYLRYTYVPDGHSIYARVKKLLPGHWAELLPDGNERLTTYWDFFEVVRRGAESPFRGSETEAAERLGELLTQAIALQRVADVPVGAFLSGGIDSSTTAAFMQQLSSKNIMTFTIGFEEDGFDESAYAEAVARHLGTRHVARTVTWQQAMDLVPELPWIYDEPFGDPSMIPTILISRLAREHVTVSLSGDAGDELFGGYGRYHSLLKVWEKVQQAGPLRPLAAACFRVAEQLAFAARLRRLARKFEVRADWLSCSDLYTLYRKRQSKWWDPRSILDRPPPLDDPPRRFASETPFHYGMASDTLEYLPGDILVKVDRAAMSASLETRVPLLDHRIVEFAWTLPEAFKIDATTTKKPLRQLLYEHVPRDIVDRPKMGFGCPVGEWVRGPLRDWAEELMEPGRLRQQGLLDVARATAYWKMHRDGHSDDGYQMWTLLMLQAWLAHSGATP